MLCLQPSIKQLHKHQIIYHYELLADVFELSVTFLLVNVFDFFICINKEPSWHLYV